ncbi:MAG: SDR family oxidoreductase [Erysipelotrichia bacterium]|nr:SDR family oxidoreductase [Erysipelotrichia bacterium]
MVTNGFFVYIHYNSNHQKAQNLLEEIDNKGELISFDIKDKESIKNSLENLDVDVLINNAGIIKDNLFFFMSDDEWEDVINTNLNGNFYITKIISKNMMMNKKGSIVNIASISGVSGNAGQANYSSSKGAIIALTKTLCLELGRYNIRVNAIAPAIIESEMTKDIPNLKEMKKAIPLGRFGTANEVAKCAYFIGVDATYISGEVLNISGGMIR